MTVTTTSKYQLPEIKHSFDLTEDQSMIRDMVREFALAEVEPIAADIDEHHRFPQDTWKKIVELGLPGIPFSEDLGGSNGGTLAYCLAVEEISRVCASTGLTLAAHVSLGTYPIYAWGAEALRVDYVPRLIAGEYMGAYGLTEPGAGSDSGATRTTAVRDGDEWVLNGRKCFCTNANFAGTFIVTAVTDKSLGPKGISAFVVPRGIDGFSLEKGEEKLGMRGSDWASLVFEDARIPKDHLLGPEGQGFVTFMKTLEGGRVSIGALGLGIAQGAYDCALQYAKEREAFGKRLADHQVIRHKIAEMKQRINATQAYALYISEQIAAGEPNAGDIALLKVQCSQTMEFCAREAMQILGGIGYMRGGRVERIYREVRVNAIGGGSEEIMRDLAARQYGL